MMAPLCCMWLQGCKVSRKEPVFWGGGHCCLDLPSAVVNGCPHTRLPSHQVGPCPNADPAGPSVKLWNPQWGSDNTGAPTTLGLRCLISRQEGKGARRPTHFLQAHPLCSLATGHRSSWVGGRSGGRGAVPHLCPGVSAGALPGPSVSPPHGCEGTPHFPQPPVLPPVKWEHGLFPSSPP